MQHASVTREQIDTAWTLAFIRTCLILVFFLLAAWPLSVVYDDPRLMPVFIVSGLTGAFLGLFNPHMNLATKEMRFGPLTIFQICQKGAGLVVAIVLAFMFEELLGDHHREFRGRRHSLAPQLFSDTLHAALHIAAFARFFGLFRLDVLQPAVRNLELAVRANW